MIRRPLGADCDVVIGGVLPRSVRLAVAYMVANLERPSGPQTLAAVSGVAERTLHAQFKSFVGCPPMRHFLALRLDAARDALTDPSRSVTAVATRFGFHHLGRFSVSYRARHGEAPSETLRRVRDPERRRCVALQQHDRPIIAIPPVSFASTDVIARELAAALRDLIATGLARVALIASDGLASTARYRVISRVMRASGMMRVTIRIIEAATGRQLWGDVVEGATEDSFGVITAAANKLVRAQNTAVREAEIDRAWQLPIADLQTRDLTLRALRLGFMTNMTTAAQALELLNRAMTIDPEAALPVAMAAWCHAQIITFQGDANISWRRTEAARLASLAGVLDPDDALVLTLRGALHTMIGELAVGGALVARALARDPTSGFAWQRAGWHQTFAGNPERAIHHFRRAIQLDAKNQEAHGLIGIGTAHFEAGRYAEAARDKCLAIRKFPDKVWANRTLAVSLARIGETTAAREALLAFRRYAPNVTIGQVMDAVPFSSDFRARLANGLDGLGLPA